MPETIVFDQFVSGTLQIVKNGIDDASVIATYTITDINRTAIRSRTRVLILTVAEQTAVNNFWNNAVNKVRALEGL